MRGRVRTSWRWGQAVDVVEGVGVRRGLTTGTAPPPGTTLSDPNGPSPSSRPSRAQGVRVEWGGSGPPECHVCEASRRGGLLCEVAKRETLPPVASPRLGSPVTWSSPGLEVPSPSVPSSGVEPAPDRRHRQLSHLEDQLEHHLKTYGKGPHVVEDPRCPVVSQRGAPSWY